MRRRVPSPETPTEYPVGTYVLTEKGYFYIATPNKRYRFLSERVLASWRPHRIAHSTEAALVNYRVAAKMKFRPGSLIHNLADGKIYLIVGALRHQVTSPDTLSLIGAVDKDIVTVSQDEILLHELGEPLK